MRITSLHNPRLKAARQLQDRRGRQAAGLTLVEGADELALALAAGIRPATVFLCPELQRPAAAGLRARLPAETEVLEVTPEVFAKLAYRENPDGWLATAPLPGRPLAELSLPAGRPALLLVCEAVEKPGNLGAMLRTADAAGVDALLVCDPATDLGNPNVIRSSRGAVFSVPTALTSTAAALAWLKARGVLTVAATPQAERLYTEVDLRGPAAIAVGAEDAGLSAPWLSAADLAVRIPMAGRVNSLNVAASAALLVYEAVRQRAMV
ncbi:MAG: RNA methyltransferase [Anaerolineales bacterium]|nr:RNA methyltransferase [Anaerolineales bacterium]